MLLRECRKTVLNKFCVVQGGNYFKKEKSVPLSKHTTKTFDLMK